MQIYNIHYRKILFMLLYIRPVYYINEDFNVKPQTQQPLSVSTIVRICNGIAEPH